MPRLFVIAGPNGAGKTTYARRFLSQEMNRCEFLNGDMIAAGLSPLAPERAAFDAGRVLLARARELAGRGDDFAIETTLSGRTYVPLLQQMRLAGYDVRLDFLWVSDLSVTRERVRQRVAKGGHAIPELVQQRRFYTGIRNLATLYRPLLNYWRLFDNTGERPHPVAHEREGIFSVHDATNLASIERVANVTFMPPQPPTVVHEPGAYAPDAEMRAAVRALRMAYADAVLENLRFGLPVIQYADGKVVEVPAEQLAPRARRILEANGEFLPEEAKPVRW